MKHMAHAQVPPASGCTAPTVDNMHLLSAKAMTTAQVHMCPFVLSAGTLGPMREASGLQLARVHAGPGKSRFSLALAGTTRSPYQVDSSHNRRIERAREDHQVGERGAFCRWDAEGNRIQKGNAYLCRQRARKVDPFRYPEGVRDLGCRTYGSSGHHRCDISQPSSDALQSAHER